MGAGTVRLGNEMEIEFNDDDEIIHKEELDSTVDLDFFDEDTNDFRLNVEGASGFGKTNTLAVIIEELADFNIPTLVLDRLGVLTTAAIEVDNMVVVGARDEPGIDVAIPLGEVEVIVDMLLEQGMKVMMDLQTYKGLGDEEEQTLHRAVATVLEELMDRSHEMMRSGNRKRSLVIADEVHHLAPETGTQHVDPIDRNVKKCRSVLMNLATEGGNKGVSSIYSYQRRALTKNTVVSQSDNYIVHRLESGDKDRASKATGIPKHYIDSLEVGEVVVKGKITDQKIVGPLKVRRRESPDPREEKFEVPEPPEEIGDALEQIQEQVEQKEQERQERQDKIQQLEEELEKKEKTIERLQDEVDVAETIRRAVEQDGGGEVDEEVVKELEQLREEKEELEDQLEEAHREMSELEKEKEELRYEKEDLEAELQEYEELDRARDTIVGDARDILRQLGAADPDAEEAREEVNELQERVQELQEQNEKLRSRDTSGEPETKIESYKDWLNQEVDGEKVVRQAIEDAKEESSASPRYVKGVIANIIRNEGWVGYQEIAENLGVKNTNDVSSAATTLESKGIIQKEKRDGSTKVDLNTGDEGIQEIIRKRKKQKETQELMEEL